MIPQHIQSQVKGVIACGTEAAAVACAQSTVVALMKSPSDDWIQNIRATRLLVLSHFEQYPALKIMQMEDMLKNQNDLVWEITRYQSTEIPWESLIHFFQQAWDPLKKQVPSHDVSNIQTISYPSTNPLLEGYLAVPASSHSRRYPAVVLLPNWDGVNLYEQQRIQLLANEGLVAMAADIYGKDLHHNLTLQQMIQQSTYYRETHVDDYLQRIQYALDYVASLPFVDPTRLGLAGYCFGGTGVIQYVLTKTQPGLQVATAFHGGLQPKYLPSQDRVSPIHPYVLVLSGGSDDAHGNQSVLESAFQAADEWEISRYAGVYHGFTEWENPAYNLNADTRSWDAFLRQLRARLQPNVTETSRRTFSSISAWLFAVCLVVTLVLVRMRRRKQHQQYAKLCQIPVPPSRKPSQKQK
ncbi:carboxymethylenebutenolidase [Fistulifera solaris]|uniref:Carboxymethylenebutenolidase n=1 Tax=Fistulifera solaris TaxID=1519565 RepID=A0A1Z5K0I2_FISSO|nr:carboxymethylenebutenolidase [Fistulifera solaris]|eukprot:GAX19528.1 carboxymethylenebutenolidase [Fistulifera solaris]